MSEWISVDDQLPDTSRDVMVATQSGEHQSWTIAFYERQKWEDQMWLEDHWAVTIGEYPDGNRVVTHWREIPAMPNAAPQREREGE